MIINGTSRIKEDAGDYVVLDECGGEVDLEQYQTLPEAVEAATANHPYGAVLKLVRITVDELGGKPPGDMPF